MERSSNVVLIILFLFGCTIAPKTHTDRLPEVIEYYSTIPLRESPYPPFQGVIRLGRKEAIKRNHYRFEYDDVFRLKSVSFWLGNQLRDPNHTANYFFTTPMQKYSYEANQQVVTFYDRFGNQTTQRGVYKEIYDLDSIGRRISLRFENESGSTIENQWGIARYEWEHQTDGSVIEARLNLAGELKPLRPNFEFFRIRLYYAQNGLLSLMQNIDSTGQLINNSSGVAQDKLIFDREGRWLGWNVLNANHQLHRGNGPNVAKGINIPDEYGYETGIRYEDVDGTPIINAHGFWGSRRFYDHLGNYSSTYFTDSLGMPGINEQSGYCYAVYTWDDRGLNRLKVELLDAQKNPVAHRTRGYTTIKYEYDEDDHLIKTQYLGLQGEPIDRSDNGVSYYVYRYDQQHRRIETLKYNKLDELLP